MKKIREKNSKIGVGIVTFLRDDCLFRLVDSLRKYYPELRLYIVDQGRETSQKNVFYTQLIKEGHVVKYITFDAGILRAKKFLKEIIEEPYILFLEDDLEVTKSTNIYPFLTILERDKSVGVVGGRRFSPRRNKEELYNYFFLEADRRLIYVPVDYYLNLGILKWKEVSNIRYIYTDIVEAFALWRKEIPSEIFDENIKTLDHSFLFFNLKKKTKWKVAYTPEPIILHHHERTNQEYLKYRGDKERRRKDELYFLKCFGLEKVFYPSSNPFFRERKIKPLNIEKKFNAVLKKEFTETVVSALKEVLDSGVFFVVVRETCLDAIRFKKLVLKPDILHMAVRNEEDLSKIKQLVKDIGFNFEISIEDFKKTKKATLYGFDINVPYPVVGYLKRNFLNWEEYGLKGEIK